MINKRTNQVMTKHHLYPKVRKKTKTLQENQVNQNYDIILKLWRDRHDYFHQLFGTMTIDEIIECFQRIKRIKIKKPIK